MTLFCRQPFREKSSLAPCYSVLFLGRHTDRRTLLFKDSTDCWRQVTIALHAALDRLRNVACTFRDNQKNERSDFYDGLPKADGVLFWGLPNTWLCYDHQRLRQTTGCRAIITIGAQAITNHADWSFSFSDRRFFSTRVQCPISRALYRQSVKTPRSVLIDHWGGANDWTFTIEEWLKDLGNDFSVWRYVQDEGDPYNQGSLREVPPYLKQISRMPFPEWLAATDTLETFVMTHSESYGYALLDMFARGIRVLCPKPLVPRHFRATFHIETFNNKDELVTLLDTRPDVLKLVENRTHLTDWDDVAQAIDSRFRRLLRCRKMPSHV